MAAMLIIVRLILPSTASFDVFQCRARCYAGYRQEPARVEKEGWASETRCHAASVCRAQPVMRCVDRGNSTRCDSLTRWLLVSTFVTAIR